MTYLEYKEVKITNKDELEKFILSNKNAKSKEDLINKIKTMIKVDIIFTNFTEELSFSE